MTQRHEELVGAPRAAGRGPGPGGLGGLDRFERGVVFRVARGAFLVMAALGGLALVVGVGALCLGLWRPPIPAPAVPPPVPAPVQVTAQQAEGWLQAQEVARREQARLGGGATGAAVPASAPSLAPAPTRIDPEELRRQELTRLLSRLRGLLPPPQYQWDDSYEDVCRVPSAYGCLQSERRLARPGLFTQLKQAMAPVPGEDVLPALQDLCAALEQAAPARRGALLPAIVALRAEGLARYRREVQARAAQVDEARRDHERLVAEQQEEKQRLRGLGLYGAGAGLALLVLVSLFLTHFAIERHLRLLRGVTDLLASR